MKLRTISLEVCKVLSRDIAEQHNEIYMSVLREPAPLALRTPTISEVRMMDCLICTDVYKIVAEGSGSGGRY